MSTAAAETSTDGTAFEAGVTAFMLIKTQPRWLRMTVEERIAVFTGEIISEIQEKVSGVRSRFFDTEAYTARVTDIWVWEARDHATYQRLIDVLRETPFWDDLFEIVEILVGVENGYAKSYGMADYASVEV